MNCKICNKKVKISSYPCKCSFYFCKLHIFSENHDCSFNYKDEQKKIIEIKNPKIIPTKL